MNHLLVILSTVLLIALVRVDGLNLRQELRSGSRIAGGTQAARNQFPFAVVFFIYTRNDQSICSGSILSNLFVLSAAHCFNDMESSDLLAGVHNVVTEIPTYELEIFPSDVTIHEGYVRATFLNDVAVVSTRRRPFVFGAAVQTVPLIPRSMANNNLTSIIGRVAGWGITRDSHPNDISPVPMFIDAPIVSNPQCAVTFGNSVTNGNLCLSGANGRSTCPGDSGGGLTIQHGTTRILVGVVSFGSANGCQLGHPTVFSRVSSFHDWIQRVTGITIP